MSCRCLMTQQRAPRPPTSPGCTTVLASRTKGHLLKSVQVATTSVDATRGLVMSASTTSSFGGSLVFLSVWWGQEERGRGAVAVREGPAEGRGSRVRCCCTSPAGRTTISLGARWMSHTCSDSHSHAHVHFHACFFQKRSAAAAAAARRRRTPLHAAAARADSSATHLLRQVDPVPVLVCVTLQLGSPPASGVRWGSFRSCSGR